MPPAPEKDMLGTTKLKLSKDDAAPSEFIEKRKAALERFLNRCAKHPKLKYDPDFRDFIENAEYSTKPSNASKFDMIKVFKNVGDAMNKISGKITEPDQVSNKMITIRILFHENQMLFLPLCFLSHCVRSKTRST